MIWEKFKKILIMIGVLKNFKNDYNRFENDFYFSFKFWNILVMFLIFWILFEDIFGMIK